MRLPATCAMRARLVRRSCDASAGTEAWTSTSPSLAMRASAVASATESPQQRGTAPGAGALPMSSSPLAMPHAQMAGSTGVAWVTAIAKLTAAWICVSPHAKTTPS